MSLLPIYQKYRDDVEFMVIYIREAHPTDKWWLAETKFMQVIANVVNPYPSYDIQEPRSIDERRSVAKTCSNKLLADIPVYIDNMDNQVDLKYVAWPTRTYFIGEDGRVVFDSGLGPYGLSYAELDKTITAYTAQK
ncbi:MAG: hypothetical protein OET90_03960 [Desulfuromonadales bacterium]|nr:hypothetical protein [Desulfuromonadales bacterium]